MSEELKYDYLLSISNNNFAVDTVEIFCPRLRKSGRRTDTFIAIYCKDCKFKCEGKLLRYE